MWRAILYLLLLSLCGCASFERDTSRWDSPLQREPTHIPLSYSQQGSGRDILLIHGFGASRFTWRAIAPALAKHYRVTALDLKGFGLSAKPRDKRYTAYDQAAQVSHFIRQHKLHNPIVIGHSFGGAVSLATALYLRDYPQYKPRALVLIDSIAYPQELPLFVELLATPLLGPAAVHTLPNSFQVRTLLKKVYFDDSLINEQAVTHYAQHLARANAKYALIQSARQLMPEDLAAFNQSFALLSQPSLILSAAQGDIVPLWVAQKLAGALDKSELVVVQQ
ncbi:MAG: alpha/beta fold hydrolase, partial [Pseudomonadales bacterium]